MCFRIDGGDEGMKKLQTGTLTRVKKSWDWMGGVHSDGVSLHNNQEPQYSAQLQNRFS